MCVLGGHIFGTQMIVVMHDDCHAATNLSLFGAKDHDSFP